RFIIGALDAPAGCGCRGSEKLRGAVGSAPPPHPGHPRGGRARLASLHDSLRRLPRELSHASRIVREEPEEVAHGHAHRLFAPLVLVKGPRPTAEQLTGLALAQAELLPDPRDLVRPEHAVHLGLQLEESTLARQERLPRQHALTALRAPP